MNYPSATGQFSTKQLPALPQSLTWQMTYGSTALTLTVVRQMTIDNPQMLSNGHFQFTLSGPNATSVAIETSTNLLDWTPLVTNAPFNGNYILDDAAAGLYSNRFYQVRITP